MLYTHTSPVLGQLAWHMLCIHWRVREEQVMLARVATSGVS